MKKLYNFFGPILSVLFGLSILLIVTLSILPSSVFKGIRTASIPFSETYGTFIGIAAGFSLLAPVIPIIYYFILGMLYYFKKNKKLSRELLLRVLFAILLLFALFFALSIALSIKNPYTIGPLKL